MIAATEAGRCTQKRVGNRLSSAREPSTAIVAPMLTSDKIITYL